MTAKAVEPAEGFFAVVAVAGGACSASPWHLVRDEVQIALNGHCRHVKGRRIPPYSDLLFRRISKRPQSKCAIFLGSENGIVTGFAVLIFAVLKPHMRYMPE